MTCGHKSNYPALQWLTLLFPARTQIMSTLYFGVLGCSPVARVVVAHQEQVLFIFKLLWNFPNLPFKMFVIKT